MLRQSDVMRGALAWFYFAPLSAVSADLRCTVQRDAPHLPCLLVGSLLATSPNRLHFMVMFFTEDNKVSSPQ